MKYLKFNDKVPPNAEFFDGENWVKVRATAYIGGYVSKNAAKKKLFRVR
jgi:hypothetical protein